MKQQSLFSPFPILDALRKPGEQYPVDPHVDITANKSRHNPQSTKANKKAAPRKNNMRYKIYCFFQANGDRIAEDALAAFPGWRYSSVTARISELRRDGFLEQVGERLTSYSNSPAALLRVTDKPYPVGL